MRARYVRFKDAVMTPGKAGTEIRKALVPTDETRSMVNREEQMTEIFVGECWVTLRNDKGVRITHASNVRDFEPAPDTVSADEAPKPRKERAA